MRSKALTVVCVSYYHRHHVLVCWKTASRVICGLDCFKQTFRSETNLWKDELHMIIYISYSAHSLLSLTIDIYRFSWILTSLRFLRGLQTFRVLFQLPACSPNFPRAFPTSRVHPKLDGVRHSEPQTWIEPTTTFWPLVRCSNHWATRTRMAKRRPRCALVRTRDIRAANYWTVSICLYILLTVIYKMTSSLVFKGKLFATQA